MAVTDEISVGVVGCGRCALFGHLLQLRPLRYHVFLHIHLIFLNENLQAVASLFARWHGCHATGALDGFLQSKKQLVALGVESLNVNGYEALTCQRIGSVEGIVTCLELSKLGSQSAWSWVLSCEKLVCYSLFLLLSYNFSGIKLEKAVITLLLFICVS